MLRITILENQTIIKNGLKKLFMDRLSVYQSGDHNPRR